MNSVVVSLQVLLGIKGLLANIASIVPVGILIHWGPSARDLISARSLPLPKNEMSKREECLLRFFGWVQGKEQAEGQTVETSDKGKRRIRA